MRRLRRGIGDQKLGCALWMILLAAIVVVLVKAAPVRIKSAQLKDYMTEQAKFSQRTSAARLKKRIVHRAHELELPVNPKNVKVIKGRGNIRMTADYTVPLDFYVYKRNWDFHLVVDEPVFIW
jgi:hypothetical protein